jgi:CubicO group peptidase (beta-lactamase class C family)
MATALLADEGKIDLDAPVRTYLPDFVLEDPISSATLTTRDVLTHRSGLPRHDLFWYGAPLSRDGLYRRLRFLEPSGPPHARWRYNSLMFVVAGRIVEKVSGESWETFVQRRILSPLGMRRTLLSVTASAADRDHATPYAIGNGGARRMPVMMPSNAIAPAGGVATSMQDLARWLTFHMERTPSLLGEAMWRELHRPQAKMPEAAEPEVQHPYYALGWVHESYRGHTLLVHNGAIDGFTVHLGFVPEAKQGLILLMNRDLASTAVTALAFSAYDRILGLEPIDWATRLVEPSTSLQDVHGVALDFALQTVVGRYTHPAYGALTVREKRGELVLQFRTRNVSLVYQGDRRFLSREPITDGAPQITLRFSEPKSGVPLRVSVPLNFDDGDPVEVFTRVG